MDRETQTILLRDNPWLLHPERLQPWLQAHLPSPHLKRSVADSVCTRWHDASRAHLVIGPRQAGKSTLLWAWLNDRGQPALAIDCEQRLVRSWCRSAPLFLEALETLVEVPPALLFDEIQHLDDAGLFIKGLVDRRYPAPILVTGSSSYHLGARTHESLAGRATRTLLLPFSLQEVTMGAEKKPASLRRQLLEQGFCRHLALGGYPDVWLADEPTSLLHDLVEAFVLRDASDRFAIERPDAFKRLMVLLAQQTGSLVNYSEWASILGISRDTVSSYLSILEETHIIATLRPFVGGKRAELTSTPKVYLVDNGIRSHLVGDLRALDDRPDRGAALENWVFTELWKSTQAAPVPCKEKGTLPLPLEVPSPPRYWRSTSGTEVDFVLQSGTRLAAVEVKAQPLVRPRLPRSARSFINAYQPEILWLVNTALEHEDDIEGTRVHWTTPWLLPDEVRRWQDGGLDQPQPSKATAP